MPIYKVKVKWGKENYPSVDLNTEEQPLLFKAQLFALTGVQPERQKVMFKGKVVNDDTWDSFPVKEGSQLLLMGTVDDLPEEPTEKTVFMEDMSENELASALELPTGLTNLGNTCYLNATVQCLRTVPELRQALSNFTEQLSISSQDSSRNMTAAMRDLFESMERTATIAPIILVQVLHLIFPRFAEKAENGGFMQQDANECWTELLRMLQQRLKPLPQPSSDSGSVPSASSYSSIVDQFFGGSFSVTLKNTENDEEPETHSTEDFLQLSCFISTDIRYLQSGLKSRLNEQVTKHSPTLNRDAVYNKTCKISRLPSYLTIQFVRFFYKERGATNAKILKDIKFTLSLDLFDLCSEELQQKLIPMREKFKEVEDAALELNAIKNDKKENSAPETETPQQKTTPHDVNQQKIKKFKHPYHFPDDVGSNNSGYYELQAVLTHKGRSSSSGHYIAWVKRKENEWFKCDDDNVTLVTSEEILKLSGGGDWHCAYVLLYGPRILETNEPPAGVSGSVGDSVPITQ